MNASSAMPGMVCSTPTARITASAPPRRRSSTEAERHAPRAIAAASETATSSTCRAVSASSVRALGPEIGGQTCARLSGGVRASSAAVRLPSEPELRQRIARDARHRLAIHLHPPVERPHRRLAEAAAQLGQRRHRLRTPLGEARGHQRRRLVRRKEAAVVLQHDQVVLAR